MPPPARHALTPADYRRRRRALARAIGRDGIAILPAAGEVTRNRDVQYPFRQDSDFLYLTAFPEPEAWAVIAPRRAEGEFVLFCRPRDPEREQWQGTRIGPEGALEGFGADEAHPLEELDKLMPTLLDGRARVHYPLGASPDLDARVIGWINQVRAKARTGAVPPESLVNLGLALHELRLRKSPAELDLMRRAAAISAAAHLALMRHCAPGVRESELEAEFHAACARAGARFQAYPPIVAGGPQTCILHYTDNGDVLRDGDLVLIDAGCELDCYASDITRTFPVNGRFSPAQRELYDLVLAAQRAALARVRPGSRWNEPHEAAVRVLTKGLIRLGILKGRLGKLVKDEAYKPYYMHRTGHWLGMDVHDVGSYKVKGEWRVLEPGMTLTVEPGLYLPDTEAVPEPYRRIGIRIEDDVLVTENGHEILSAAVPKDPEAIEAAMGGG